MLYVPQSNYIAINKQFNTPKFYHIDTVFRYDRYRVQGYLDFVNCSQEQLERINTLPLSSSIEKDDDRLMLWDSTIDELQYIYHG